MQERDLGRVRPEMDVCDINGDKVGTIAHVYRDADAVPGVGTSAATGERSPYEEVIEVKTGFLGLGSHLYIPLSAVHDTLEDCVFVNQPKDAFESVGWHEKPTHLDQLH